ncbi:MAG: hypothetical protein ACJ72O_10585 [Marmoricola sp.]
MSHRLRRLLPAATALAVAVTLLLLPNLSAVAVTNGTVAGTLTGSGGALSQGTVEAYKVSAPNEYPAMISMFGGNYSLSLAPGQYYLRYTGSSDAGSMAPEWWNDSSTRQSSTPVTITSGGTITANVDLAPGGSIAGYVATDYKQVGFHDTSVDVYQQDSTYPSGWVRLFSTEVSGEASDGRYLARNLPSGNYRLHFYSQITAYEGWWPNAATLDTATSIPVTAPTAVTDIDPTLTKAGSVSGRVSATSNGASVPNSHVILYRKVGSTWEDDHQSAVSASNGTYKLFAPAGTYRVYFAPDVATKFRREYWNNSATASGSTPVTVTVGSDTTGINAKLEKNVFKLTSAAAITGVYKVGQTLKAVPPKSTPTSTTTTYQWLRDGKPITGTAAKRSYWKLVTADRHHKIGVKITLNRFGYVSLYRIVTKSTVLP